VRPLTKALIVVALLAVGALMMAFRSEPGPGRPDVTVPFVISDKLGSAATDLQDLGLCVGVEPGEATGSLADLVQQHPRRYVVGELPGAGAMVPERSLVILRIRTEHEISRVLYQVAQTNRAMTCPAGSGVTDANA
jgi:beta-lactam-binding protein with PASTA domain